MRQNKNTIKKEKVEKSVRARTNKSLSSDILLLFFGLVAVFFFLSLVSYSSTDPGYANIEFSRFNDEKLDNLFGKTGAYIASFLGFYFGWTALFIPFLSIYLSILIYRYKKGLTFMMSPVFGFIYGMGIIISLSIISGLAGGIDFYFTTQPSGATLGAIGSSFIESLVGKVGGIIVFLVAVIAFSMLLFSISFSDMGHGFRVLFKYIKAFIAVIKNIFSSKKESEEYEVCEHEEIDEEDIKNKINSFFTKIKEKLFGIAKKETNTPIALSSRENKQAEQLLDKYELEAISNIQFISNNSDEIKKEGNIIDIDIDQEKNSETENTYEEVKEQAEEIKENKEEIIESEAKEEKIEIRQAYEEIDEPYNEKEESSENIEIRKMEKAKAVIFANYNIPLGILQDSKNKVAQISEKEMKAQGELLTEKLLDFGVSGTVRAIQPGPVVTMFEFEPSAGTRVSKIAALESDLALSLSALSIRIIAPIPGKNAVGIEIPNKNRQSVSIKELLKTPEFKNSKSPLTVALGKDVIGKPYMSDIKKMPHLLVAGTTGSGKSVGINTMICSILFKASPEEVKFIMIDPKMVELSIYEGIPHLMAPVVTDTRLAASVLKNVVAEMTRRYTLLAEKKVRNLDGYNELIKDDEMAEKMPYLVVIVDEFADLMMVAGKDVEMSIARIAQMARAVGIHLIIATQRPTTNVITGLIKANMPARLSFKVSQKNDSRVIIDQNGADTLLGMGDSLFIPPGTSDAIRIHGAFVSDDEVRGIVEYLQAEYGKPEYNMAMVQEVKEGGSAGKEDDEETDALYNDAVDLVMDKGTASISMIQRVFKIGYNRAARIVETMEARGILEPSDGTAKPRKVIRR